MTLPGNSVTLEHWHAHRTALTPHTALILGSGLGAVTDRLQDALAIPFAMIPELPAGTVQGHAHRIWIGVWADQPVVLFQGRLHRYEGYSRREASLLVHLAGIWGVKRVFLTNAAGGIREDLEPGSLMPLCAHRTWATPASCLREEATGYTPELLEQVCRIGRDFGLAEPGVYGYLLGPNYETPSEIRAMGQSGIDAVGMSTVPEVECAAAQGMACSAISCITNRAAGLAGRPLTHAEVLQIAGQQIERLAALLETLLRQP